MIARLLTVCALVLMAAAPVAAQALRLAPVRAVEHPEYSRLVLPVQSDTAVSVSQSGATAVVRLEGSGPSLDVGHVFDRMPRTRILSVQVRLSEDGVARELKLSLACSCAVQTQRLASGFLTIDVRRRAGAATAGGRPAAGETGAAAPEGAPVLESGAPSSADALPGTGGAPEHPQGRAVQPAYAGGTILRPLQSLPGLIEEPALEPEPGSGPSIAAAPGSDRPRVGAGAVDRPPGTEDEAALTDPVLAARAALLRELERAAGEGLLDLGPEAATELGALRAQAAEAIESAPMLPSGEGVSRAAEARPTVPELIGPTLVPRLTPHLTIRGPSEAYPELIPAAEPRTDPPYCPGDTALDIDAWAVHEGSFATEIGRLRRDLVDKSGTVDPAAVAALARHYIANGFGREAAQILTVMGENLADRALLHDVAQLLEGREAAPNGPVIAAGDCLGRVTLWRAAAGIEPFDPDTPSGQEIEAALLELPPVLRRLMGQAVARHALLGDKPRAARHVIGILDRTPGQPNAAEIRVRAQLAHADGVPERAMQLLAPAVGRASPDPQSLMVYTEAVLALGPPAPAGLSITLAAVAAPLPEHSGPGLELRLLKARLDAADGAPLEALARLRALSTGGQAPGPAVVGAARDILVAFDPLAHTPEVAARVIIENAVFLGNDAESAGLRLTYAEALVAAGLPSAALTIVGEAQQVMTADMRLLAASARLKLGAPGKALELLAPVEGEQAARFRAEAHVRQGNMPAAFEALGALDPADPERERLALLAGRWSALPAVAEPAVMPRLVSYARAAGAPADDGREGTATAERDLAPEAEPEPAAAPTVAAPTREVAAAALDAARNLQTALQDLQVSPTAPAPTRP